jgi:WD40 repeat protein
MSLSLAAAMLLALAQDLPQRSLAAHAQGTTQVRSTSDGKLLLTTGLPDRTVKVWLLSTGKVLHTLGRQTECFSIRPDGGLAAVGEAEGTTVWNLTTGQVVHSIAAGRTIALGWSAEGKTLTTVGLKGERGKPGVFEVRIWDLPAAAAGPPVLVPLSRVPSCVAVSPNGTLLAVPHWEGGLRVWDLAKDRVVLQQEGSAVTSVAWSPNGRVIATATSDHAVRFLDAETGKELKTVLGDYDHVPAQIEFSPDGAWAGVSGDGGIRLWKTDAWTPAGAFYGGPGTGIWAPASFDFAADGRTLIGGGTLIAKDAPASGRVSGPVYFWKLRR